MSRTVRKLHRAISDDIGDLRTQRPLPNPELDQLDPFLFLNHHGPQVYPPKNHGLPFGLHPHRGFETVTFILDGSLAHGDTGGNQSVIEAGGVQWMTAGRGLEHSETSPADFRRDGGPLEILQLWVNLPARLKMTDPRYVGVQKEQIPVVEFDGARVNVISGEWEGVSGAIQSITGIVLTTIGLRAGAHISLPAPANRAVFLYVVRGNVRVSGTHAAAFHLVEMNADGDAMEIEATDDAFLIFGHGDPYHEPVVAHGPFVMNSFEEIVEAVRDYQAGKFR